jgi:outer membrane lipoprotein SlyB
MNSLFQSKKILAAVLVLSLGACANMNTPATSGASGGAYPPAANAGSAYVRYGVVQSIELVPMGTGTLGGTGIGVGAIAGAVVGGIVGNQVGKGGGNTAATVLGAAGGAYAGHELEKRNQQQANGYKFTIRLNDGTYQTVTQAANADIRVGDRVLIDNGVARRY